MGHRGQGGEQAALPAVRRRVARRRARLLPRQRRDRGGHARVRRAARKKLGYRAIRAQCATPGQPDAYGVAKAARRYEPAERGLPRETAWSTEPYLQFTPALFERIRREFGPELHLLHDVHHRLRPIEAARLGKSLEPYHLFWMEDPVPAELQEGFRIIRQHTTTPIAVGEVFDSIYDCYRLIQEQLIDYLRATVVHGGGLTPLRKMAALAELYHVRTGCHGATDLSPIAMGAALHFDLSVHNFGIQEHMPHTDETDRVFPHAYSFQRRRDASRGHARVTGSTIDETLAASYPYQRAYLPVARLEDGTLHSW